MKILTQNKRVLIDTDYIYLNDINLVKAITKLNEDIVLGEYKEIELTWERHVAPSFMNPMGTIGEHKTITSIDVCELVFKDIVEYFKREPNGIYTMPTQEGIEIYLKEDLK